MKNIYVLIMFVMLVWGFNVAAIKTLVTYIDPLLITAVRIFTAGIGVLIICYFMRIFRFPSLKETGIILTIGFFNVIAHHSLMAAGLLHTSGINAGLIAGINPLVTLLFSVLFTSMEVTFQKVIGFLLGFTGVAVTILAGSDGTTAVSVGDLLVFLSIIAQSVSFILISKMKPEFDVRLFTGYLLVVGSIVIFFLGLAGGGNLNELGQIFSLKLGFIFLFSALICTAAGHMVYNYSIQKIGPAETTIFINFNTFFALVGSVIFLGESMRIHHFYGLIFIVCGVLIGTGAIENLIKKRYRRTS